MKVWWRATQILLENLQATFQKRDTKARRDDGKMHDMVADSTPLSQHFLCFAISLIFFYGN